VTTVVGSATSSRTILTGFGVVVMPAGADIAREPDRFLVDLVSAVALSPYLRHWMLMRAGYSVSGQVSGSFPGRFRVRNRSFVKVFNVFYMAAF